MLDSFIQSVVNLLGGIVALLVRLALPLALACGLVSLAVTVALIFGREKTALDGLSLRQAARRGAAWGVLALCVCVGWTILRAVPDVARREIEWRQSAEATANPTPDAEPIYQSGPAVAALVEKTYTRTLTLPPSFLERIGTEGIGILSPYLTDPSAENVLRLRDTFARSGQDVVFTREVTRLDEEPLPVKSTNISLKFQRLAERAYDVAFDGNYIFENPTVEPRTVRCQFSLPYGVTVRDVSIRVGDTALAEPNEQGAYEWRGELRPGERRELHLRYHARGAHLFHYDLGSQRRRVQQFKLEVTGSGTARFPRGSLEPTLQAGDRLEWSLDNVVTAQKIALAFPPDIEREEAYLQALNALGASLILFVLGNLIAGYAFGGKVTPGVLTAGLALFGLGLVATPILAYYLGGVAAVLIGPLLGAMLAAGVLGRESLRVGLPAALLPAAFLSPHHSGLLLLLLILVSLGAAVLLRQRRSLVPRG
jgi:hypothetical protein